MAELHHRMPDILDPATAEIWMDPAADPTDLQAILRPCPDDWIDAHEVGAAVGNVKNEGPHLVEPVA